MGTESRFLRNNIVRAARRVIAVMLEFAAAEIAEVFSGRKEFKTAAKEVGSPFLKKQLLSANKKQKGALSGNQLAYGKQASSVIPGNPGRQTTSSQG